MTQVLDIILNTMSADDLTKASVAIVLIYCFRNIPVSTLHYNDVIMNASLAFVRGIHRSPVNSLHKWPITRKMSPLDDVIMGTINHASVASSIGISVIILKKGVWGLFKYEDIILPVYEFPL